MATIQGIYVALFGRPADPEGLQFWSGLTDNGSDLTELVGRLTAEPEALARFDNLDSEAVVRLIYQSIFGRAPDAAGLAFYIAQLESGAQSLETIAINILDGARGTDLAVAENKIETADLFTASLDTPEEIDAYVGDNAADIARELLQGVTADPATIPTQAEVDEKVKQVESGELTPPADPDTPPTGPSDPEPEPEPQPVTESVITLTGDDEADAQEFGPGDRGAPTSITSGDGSIVLTTNAAGVVVTGPEDPDRAVPYNSYQGYSLDFDGALPVDADSSVSVSLEFHVDSEWEDDGQEQATSFWPFVAGSQEGADIVYYPILEYVDADAAEVMTAEFEGSDPATGAGFRLYNSDTKTWDFKAFEADGWVDIRLDLGDDAQTWTITSGNETIVFNIDQPYTTDGLQSLSWFASNFGDVDESYEVRNLVVSTTTYPDAVI
ncbi:DUF4214 domain-containing protein [Devosia sp. 1635]|uniref:DUF4214 domain-containing protein n=1 Tax=Devosia sp. 1635 TaxID=2726066 RepID=UPI0015664FBA|nr:DUF4214 domain-containing protein [Devosia sp. 1635]